MIIWKDIPGFEGLYQASNTGEIKMLQRTTLWGRYRNLTRTYEEHIIYKHKYRRKERKNGSFYYRVRLTDTNGKRRSFYIHTLIALTFIPNPNNYNQINHKDENGLNNNVDNLEWCDLNYNLHYGTRYIRQSQTMKNKKGGN